MGVVVRADDKVSKPDLPDAHPSVLFSIDRDRRRSSDLCGRTEEFSSKTGRHPCLQENVAEPEVVEGAGNSASGAAAEALEALKAALESGEADMAMLVRVGACPAERPRHLAKHPPVAARSTPPQKEHVAGIEAAMVESRVRAETAEAIASSAQQQLAGMKDQFLRLQADFDNFRR